MVKKKLTCFTKERNDGTPYTTCLEGQKGSKKKVKKIKPKIIEKKKPKLEIEKRTGKTREEINKAEPLSIIAKLPSELQSKITGDMKGKAELKPLFNSLKVMKGYKKREVDKKIAEIFEKNNKDPKNPYTITVRRVNEDIDRVLALEGNKKVFKIGAIAKELNKYFRDKIKELTPQELEARKKRKAFKERDRDAYNLNNFIEDVDDNNDILDSLASYDYTSNLYTNVYGYGYGVSERTDERRMEKLQDVMIQRYKRLVKDYWKNNKKKYKKLEDIVDALEKDAKDKKVEIDDYSKKSDF